MNILCILLPNFPLMCELIRHPDIKKHPVLIFDSTSSRRILFDFSPNLGGLVAGMTLERAIAMYGNAIIISADHPYYRDTFEQTLDCLQKISPSVEGGTIGTIYIETKGLELLYPEKEDLARAAREAICTDFEIRMGQAEGKFPAYLAAIYSQPGGYTALNDDLKDFLRDIPSHQLPISAKNKEKLISFGLTTLGQIAALPSSALEAQFGMEGKIIHRLANGYDDSPIIPRPHREVITENLELESATSLTQVMLAGFEYLLSRVFLTLTAQRLGISRLDINIHTINGEHQEKPIFFKSPAMEIKTVIKRINYALETWMQSGPVERLGIRVTGISCPLSRQKSFLPEVKSASHLLEEISQLEYKLGSPKVFKFKEVEPWSRIPERRHVLTPLNT